MLTLIHPVNISSLPQAKCSEHGIIASPALTETPGRLTAVWTCPVCDAENKESQADRCDRQKRKAEGQRIREFED